MSRTTGSPAEQIAVLPVIAAVFLAPSAAQATSASSPHFGPQVPVATLTPGGSTLDLTNADFTGDGLQDVLVLRGHWNSEADYPISILVNDGHGKFADKAPELFQGA